MDSIIDYDDENLIKITHYINPHMFWFKYESKLFPDEQFLNLCHKLDSYYLQENEGIGKRIYKPEVGEIVGIYNFTWQRWIRAKVDYVLDFISNTKISYIIWAMDYGMPLRVEDRFIRKLPAELASIKVDLVHFGGIADIVPAEKIYDFMTSKSKIVVSKKWSPYSVKSIDDLLKFAAYVRFKVKMKCDKNDQLFGNIEVVTIKNKIIRPEIGLIETNHALKIDDVNDFFHIVRKYKTNKRDRWLTDDGKFEISDQSIADILNINHLQNNMKHLAVEELQSLKKHELRAVNEYKQEIIQKVGDWQERNEKETKKINLNQSQLNLFKNEDLNENVEQNRTLSPIKAQNDCSSVVESEFTENIDSVSVVVEKLKKNQVGNDSSKHVKGYEKKLDTTPKVLKNIKMKTLSEVEAYQFRIYNENEEKNDEEEDKGNEEEFCALNVAGGTLKKRMKTVHPPPPSPQSLMIKSPKNEIKNTTDCKSDNISTHSDDDISILETSMKDTKKLIREGIKLLKDESSYLKNCIPAGYDMKHLQPKKKTEFNKKKSVQNRMIEFKNKRRSLLERQTSNFDDISNTTKEDELLLTIDNNNSYDQSLSRRSSSVSNTSCSTESHTVVNNRTSLTESRNLATSIETDSRVTQNESKEKSAIQAKMNEIKNKRKSYLEKFASSSKTINDNELKLEHNKSCDGHSDSNFSKKNEINKEDIVRQFKNDFMTHSPKESKIVQVKLSGLQHDYGEACIIKRNLTEHLVLVHGRQARPIEKLSNANFCDDVHRELENMRFTQIYRIQSYIWPHLMRGNSVVVVNSARTGKTMSYLPAICSLIKMKKDNNAILEAEGAVCIIIAQTSSEVEKISRISNRFFQNSSNPLSIVEAFGIRQSKKAALHLLNGCDILIATPPSLARLISDKIKYFNLKKIQYVVIDNIDLINEKKQADLHFILEKFISSNKRGEREPIQVAITTRKWHDYIFNLLKICNNPQLCIGAYIEAAIYARSRIKIKLIENNLKIPLILEFIEKHPYTIEKLVIICNSDEDVETVVNALKNLSHFVTFANRKSSATDIQFATNWTKKDVESGGSVLVCTDTVLQELKLHNVQNLIHYSLPDSWSKFTFRFSVLFGYYEDLLRVEKMTKPSAISMILLDEENNTQLPKLIEFLQNHGCQDVISKNIIDLSNQINIQREEKLIATNREFCPKLMSFGECPDQNDCRYRHILTKYDASYKHIPKEGIIIVKVLNIVSPAHYCVRILEEHLPSSIKHETNSSNYLKFNLEFSKYFNNVDNHQSHWPINIGDLCVVKESQMYFRAKIIDITQRENYNQLFNVCLKLVDVGRTIICKSVNILLLPQQFRDLPFQAINLRVSGIVPYDFEDEWGREAKSTVKHWLDSYMNDTDKKKDVVLKASILFSIMDTIWVDKIVIQENLKSISSSVYGINIKKDLIDKQFATESDLPTDLIKGMAYKCGILKVSDTEKKNSSKNIKKSKKPQLGCNFNLKTTNHIDNNTIPVSNKKDREEKYVVEQNEKFLKEKESKQKHEEFLQENKSQQEYDNFSEENKSQQEYANFSEENKSQQEYDNFSEENKSQQEYDNFSEENKSNIKYEQHHNNDLKIDNDTSLTKFSGERARARKRRSVKNLNEEKFNEKWETLTENDFTLINITAFYTPYHFYVRNIEHYERLEKLVKTIDDYMKSETQKNEIIEPKIGLNCIAKYKGKYERAKIIEVLGSFDKLKVKLFLCDCGIIEKQSLNEIYYSTQKIVTCLPFQAIRCKLIGIESITNGVWTEETCDSIYDNILDLCHSLYARPIKIEEPTLKNDLSYWKYEIVMVDCTTENDININHKIVEEGMAQYDPETKHFIDILINKKYIEDDTSDASDYYDDNKAVEINDEDNKELDNWDHINTNKTFQLKPVSLGNNFGSDGCDDEMLQNFDIQFTEEQALQLLNSISETNAFPQEIIDQLKGEKNKITEIKNEDINNTKVSSSEENDKMNTKIENISDCSKSLIKNKSQEIEYFLDDDEIKISYKTNNDDVQEKINTLDNMPALKSIYKIPNVIWQQSETLIYLKISAPDIIDYQLIVNSNSLKFIGYKHERQDLLVLVLHFLCDISPKLTSHEIRGLNVIVRLIKSIKDISWPRLTWESDKHNWLKYNYQSIVTEDENSQNTDRLQCDLTYPNSLHITTDSPSESDDEGDENDYELNINRENDEFDPFIGDF